MWGLFILTDTFIRGYITYICDIGGENIIHNAHSTDDSDLGPV